MIAWKPNLKLPPLAVLRDIWYREIRHFVNPPRTRCSFEDGTPSLLNLASHEYGNEPMRSCGTAAAPLNKRETA